MALRSFLASLASFSRCDLSELADLIALATPGRRRDSIRRL